ncbi:hypothetical protein JX266_013594 [Neoarthrinium moseri]|nr:hypothetical protein JX266_013594 [Neoarthrinium moseri]
MPALGFATQGRSFNAEQVEIYGLENIEACYVEHCHGALNIVFTWPSGLKVAYSGDCRLSDSFVKIRQGTTLLIHESTFDDELKADAIAKNHPTMPETARGFSLPPLKGGHQLVLHQDERWRINFLGLTMLAADLGITDIPPAHLEADHFLTHQLDGSELFDLVLCDEHVLRTHVRPPYRESSLECGEQLSDDMGDRFPFMAPQSLFHLFILDEAQVVKNAKTALHAPPITTLNCMRPADPESPEKRHKYGFRCLDSLNDLDDVEEADGNALEQGARGALLAEQDGLGGVVIGGQEGVKVLVSHLLDVAVDGDDASEAVEVLGRLLVGGLQVLTVAVPGGVELESLSGGRERSQQTAHRARRYAALPPTPRVDRSETR